MQFLHVAGLFALAPQLAARARPVDGALFGGGHGQGFAVHPGHHQHAAGLVILGNRRHQTVAVPVDFVEPVGHRCFRPSRACGIGF
ncbi:hypothetical protein D3C80_1744960 [compost metagenome]